MDLYLLRHAEAVARGTSGITRDADRPLTENGVKKMNKVAKAMMKMELTFDAILASPFLRAKDTAQITAEVLGCDSLVRLTSNLATSANPASIVDEINRDYPNCKSVLLVGHEPYLSGLISTLISGRTDSLISFKKSGLCKLSTDHLRYGKCATLEWLMGPSQISF